MKAYNIRRIFAIIVLTGSIFAFFGLYPVKFLDIEITPLFQRLVVDFSITALVLNIIIILFTLLFGRFYCSTVCPFGILQELFALSINKKGNKTKNYPLIYFILAACFGMLFGGSAVILRYIDPYAVFGSAFSFSLWGLITLALILALVFFKNRFFCSNICPVGAFLGILSKFAPLKIYQDKTCTKCGLCEKYCPTGSINAKETKVDNETCVKCLRCLKECKRKAVKFGAKSEYKAFNPSRRTFLISAGALILFGGMLKAGAELTEKIKNKISNVILPPGAISENRMINKCLNCNLCIKNCPNKILAPKNKDFGAVHIDYGRGKGFCKYDCNECSKVCPAGAIKKISLDTKKQTRIAIASIDPDKCSKCKICISECPGRAIIEEGGQIAANGSKCIGCGKCKKSCPNGAIEIYSIREQRTV